MYILAGLHLHLFFRVCALRVCSLIGNFPSHVVIMYIDKRIEDVTSVKGSSVAENCWTCACAWLMTKVNVELLDCFP